MILNEVKMGLKAFIVRVQEEKHKQLKQMAYEQEKTMNFLANQALREFIIKYENVKKKEK